MTLNGVVALTAQWPLHCVISLNLVNLRCRKLSVAEFVQESIVFSSVCIQCRRKESPRSLADEFLVDGARIIIIIIIITIFYFS